MKHKPIIAVFFLIILLGGAWMLWKLSRHGGALAKILEQITQTQTAKTTEAQGTEKFPLVQSHKAPKAADSNAGSDTSKKTAKYPPPKLRAPPKPASVAEGTPEERAVKFADLVDPGSSSFSSSSALLGYIVRGNRLSGWLGLYDALGVPVLGQDGVALGSTKDDPIGPRYWQVWYACGLDLPKRGISLSDAGRLFVVGLPEVDSSAFGEVLLDDLRLALQSSDPRVRLMGKFVRERVLRGSSRVDLADPSVTPQAAVIDLPTVQLLGWIAARGAMFQAASASREASTAKPKAFAAYYLAAVYLPLAQNTSTQLTELPPTAAEARRPGEHRPCSEMLGSEDTTRWANWILQKAGEGQHLPGMQKALPGLSQLYFTFKEMSPALVDRFGKITNGLNELTTVLTFAMQMLALEIGPRQIRDPLVRTHGTYYPGEDGIIELELYYNPGKIPVKIPDGDDFRACSGSFALNALGISFAFPVGPVAGAEIKVDRGEGIPDLVMFNTEGTNSMRAWTDSDGVARYKIFGAPQKRDVPHTAKPIEKQFSIIVRAQPEALTGTSLLSTFFDSLDVAAARNPVGLVSVAVDILKAFTYDLGEYVFNVTDWKQPGYKVSDAGTREGFMVCPGVICSLDKPFTVICTQRPPIGRGCEIIWTYKFVPSSAFAGTQSLSINSTVIDVGNKVIHATHERRGSYTVELQDNGDLLIALSGDVNYKVQLPKANLSGSMPDTGRGSLVLVPLDTDECNEP
jgi:hypothetical protein